MEIQKQVYENERIYDVIQTILPILVATKKIYDKVDSDGTFSLRVAKKYVPLAGYSKNYFF